jgi:hypothetical protein
MLENRREQQLRGEQHPANQAYFDVIEGVGMEKWLSLLIE